MKKIRGYKRRLRQINAWKQSNLRLDMERLKERQRDYVKFRIYPWTPLAVTMKRFPNPKGEVRRRILESLIEIYDSWRLQLSALGEPFYLKIWLFDPDIHESQVVCAIGDNLHFYDHTFYKPETTKSFRPENYGKLSKRLSEYNWDYHLHEYAILESDYKEENYKTRGEFLADRKLLEKQLRKPHRIVEIQQNGRPEKMYMIRTGVVWIVEQRNDI